MYHNNDWYYDYYQRYGQISAHDPRLTQIVQELNNTRPPPLVTYPIQNLYPNNVNINNHHQQGVYYQQSAPVATYQHNAYPQGEIPYFQTHPVHMEQQQSSYNPPDNRQCIGVPGPSSIAADPINVNNLNYNGARQLENQENRISEIPPLIPPRDLTSEEHKTLRKDKRRKSVSPKTKSTVRSPNLINVPLEESSENSKTDLRTKIEKMRENQRAIKIEKPDSPVEQVERVTIKTEPIDYPVKREILSDNENCEANGEENCVQTDEQQNEGIRDSPKIQERDEEQESDSTKNIESQQVPLDNETAPEPENKQESDSTKNLEGQVTPAEETSAPHHSKRRSRSNDRRYRSRHTDSRKRDRSDSYDRRVRQRHRADSKHRSSRRESRSPPQRRRRPNDGYSGHRSRRSSSYDRRRDRRREYSPDRRNKSRERRNGRYSNRRSSKDRARNDRRSSSFDRVYGPANLRVQRNDIRREDHRRRRSISSDRRRDERRSPVRDSPCRSVDSYEQRVAWRRAHLNRRSSSRDRKRDERRSPVRNSPCRSVDSYEQRVAWRRAHLNRRSSSRDRRYPDLVDRNRSDSCDRRSDQLDNGRHAESNLGFSTSEFVPHDQFSDREGYNNIVTQNFYHSGDENPLEGPSHGFSYRIEPYDQRRDRAPFDETTGSRRYNHNEDLRSYLQSKPHRSCQSYPEVQRIRKRKVREDPSGNYHVELFTKQSYKQKNSDAEAQEGTSANGICEKETAAKQRQEKNSDSTAIREPSMSPISVKNGEQGGLTAAEAKEPSVSPISIENGEQGCTDTPEQAITEEKTSKDDSCKDQCDRIVSPVPVDNQEYDSNVHFRKRGKQKEKENEKITLTKERLLKLFLLERSDQDTADNEHFNFHEDLCEIPAEKQLHSRKDSEQSQQGNVSELENIVNNSENNDRQSTDSRDCDNSYIDAELDRNFNAWDMLDKASDDESNNDTGAKKQSRESSPAVEKVTKSPNQEASSPQESENLKQPHIEDSNGLLPLEGADEQEEEQCNIPKTHEEAEQNQLSSDQQSNNVELELEKTINETVIREEIGLEDNAKVSESESNQQGGVQVVEFDNLQSQVSEESASDNCTIEGTIDSTEPQEEALPGDAGCFTRGEQNVRRRPIHVKYPNQMNISVRRLSVDEDTKNQVFNAQMRFLDFADTLSPVIVPNDYPLKTEDPQADAVEDVIETPEFCPSARIDRLAPFLEKRSQSSDSNKTKSL